MYFTTTPAVPCLADCKIWKARKAREAKAPLLLLVYQITILYESGLLLWLYIIHILVRTNLLMNPFQMISD